MESVTVTKEELIVYSITLPGEPEPIVLRVPSQVAHDLFNALRNIIWDEKN